MDTKLKNFFQNFANLDIKGYCITILLLLMVSSSCTSAEWTLRFIERDTVTNSGPYSDLLIYKNDDLYFNYNVSVDCSYGNTSLDLGEISEGDKLTFKLTSPNNGVGSIKLLLKDLDILHDGKPVRFTPWIFNKTADCLYGYNYSDTRLIMVIPSYATTRYCFEKGDYLTFTTQPLIDSPELVINQSDVVFDKVIYKIHQGDNVKINVTVHNIGTKDEPNADVNLYFNDILNQTINVGLIQSGTSREIQFYKKIDFGDKNFLKIDVKVVPSNSSYEGKEDNNQIVKWLINEYPYLFFSNFSESPGELYKDEEPYKSIREKIGSNVENTCFEYDYTNPLAEEYTKAICLMDMALYYHITNDEKYANRTRWGLTFIGKGNWRWLNRSLDGDCLPNQGQSSTQTYGWSIGNPSQSEIRDSLIPYALAYNWVHDYVVQYDETYNINSTEEIRDNIAKYCTDLYLIGKEIWSDTSTTAPAPGEYDSSKIIIDSSLGVGALSILDYDGIYQNFDGNPQEWINFAWKDLILQSQSGAHIPHMEQVYEDDGVYGSPGYLDYSEPAQSIFFSLYKDALDVNLNEYPLINGSSLLFPVSVMPNGVFGNYVTMYYHPYATPYLSVNLYESDSNERKLINHFIYNSLVDNTEGYDLSADNYDLIYGLFYYSINESAVPPSEPSYVTQDAEIAVLRGGWAKSSLWTWLKVKNEGETGGHAVSQADVLSFEIWGKGAYLVPDPGDTRWISLPNGESATIGHSNFMISEGEEINRVPQRCIYSTEYNCFNPAYKKAVLLSEKLDFVEAIQNVTKYRRIDSYNMDSSYTYPVVIDRGMMLVNNQYFIVFDRLESNGSHYYSMIVPLGSTEHDIGISGPSDNHVLGDLLINNNSVNWWNEDNSSLVSDQNFSQVSKIDWNTFTETNQRDTMSMNVSLQVYLNPKADVKVHGSAIHVGSYSADNDFYVPTLHANQKNNSVKYLTIYYPLNSTDSRSRAITSSTIPLKRHVASTSFSVSVMGTI